MSNKRYFRKQFARYDGNGRIIPGSNIWANKAPKHGNWVEVQAYECCNSPVCVTYNALISRGTATIAYTDCDGQMQQIECGPGVTPFCALRGSYSYDALNVLVVEAGEGCLTTTTTTLEPSTTTTTTTTLLPCENSVCQTVLTVGTFIQEEMNVYGYALGIAGSTDPNCENILGLMWNDTYQNLDLYSAICYDSSVVVQIDDQEFVLNSCSPPYIPDTYLYVCSSVPNPFPTVGEEYNIRICGIECTTTTTTLEPTTTTTTTTIEETTTTTTTEGSTTTTTTAN